MTPVNTPNLAPPPFQFGPLENAFNLDEKFCYDTGIFKWLRSNVGAKNRDWFIKVPGPKCTYLGFLVAIRIKDPATEIQFRFTLSEHEVKLEIDKHGRLTHIRK